MSTSSEKWCSSMGVSDRSQMLLMVVLIVSRVASAQLTAAPSPNALDPAALIRRGINGLTRPLGDLANGEPIDALSTFVNTLPELLQATNFDSSKVCALFRLDLFTRLSARPGPTHARTKRRSNTGRSEADARLDYLTLHEKDRQCRRTSERRSL
jgi:hypothetical protein